jgi:hypothetical protein
MLKGRRARLRTQKIQELAVDTVQGIERALSQPRPVFKDLKARALGDYIR